MTITTGWELFEDLRAAQDEMLRAPRGQGWRPGQQFSSGTTPAAWPPAVDISETKDAYLVAVSWTRCSPGEVGSLSAKPRV